MKKVNKVKYGALCGIEARIRAWIALSCFRLNRSLCQYRPSPLLLNEPMNCLQNYSSITQPRVGGPHIFCESLSLKLVIEWWNHGNNQPYPKPKRRKGAGHIFYQGMNEELKKNINHLVRFRGREESTLIQFFGVFAEDPKKLDQCWRWWEWSLDYWILWWWLHEDHC